MGPFLHGKPPRANIGRGKQENQGGFETSVRDRLEGINMTHHLLLLLLLPLLTSVCGDADPWVDNDLYYGTVYQGEFAYSAGPTTVRQKSSHSDLHAQALERSYVEAPAAYVQPAVQPAYLGHQYLSHQPTVIAAEYSTLPVGGVYATDYQSYQLPSHYSAPVAVATPSSYAAPAAIAAPVATANHGDYQSVSSSQYHSQDEEGNYAFGYNNVNGARQEEGNSLTGVMGSYTGAAGNTVRYVADQWGFRLV